jgi:hypothetical protein
LNPVEVLELIPAQYAALTGTQAKLVALSRVDGAALDPEIPDDAAILLRAETLVLGGATGLRALTQARSELAHSRGRENPVLRRNGAVHCLKHGKETRITSTAAGLVYLACGCFLTEEEWR